ncbi:hypothetical protein D3C72_527710 [compost metagenome]
MPRFADTIRDSFPPGIELPEAFVRLFDWLEAQHCVRQATGSLGPMAALEPSHTWNTNISLVTFVPVDWDHAAHWLGVHDPAVTSRLAPFVRTGGDGSYAALWRDDEDKLRFVHMGSGSGSTWAGLIADEPVDFLRFLAIGYEEPAFTEHFGYTPIEATASAHYTPPVDFRDWVEASFGVTVPPTADGLVPAIAKLDDADSDDPFWRWVRRVQSA